jgi:Zn-finger nucleic acid-binding protein
MDGSELAKQEYEANIEVEKCPQCGGIWLDHRELERIQVSGEHDYRREINRFPSIVEQAYAMALAKSKPPTPCPRCSQDMERREHAGCSQVLVDVCPKCRGVWLDEGELRALEVFFERAAIETADMRSGFFASLTDFFNRA